VAQSRSVGVPGIIPAPAGPGLAVFDLDRTLVRGSSLAVFGRVVLRRRLVPAHWVLSELARGRHFARRGEVDGEVGERTRGLADRLLARAAGRDAAPLQDAAAEAVDRIERDVFPDAARLLARHRDAGDVCVILSAGPQDLVELVSRRLGAHLGIGTRVEVVDGRLTGRLSGPLCHGPGKLVRLREELGGVTLAHTTAYSDSVSDLPLLRACGAPVAVNPDRHLLAVARREGWPVLQLRARRAAQVPAAGVPGAG